MLLDSHKVSKDLCGVEFVCKSVPDGNLRVLCQVLNEILTVAAVLNTVVHRCKNARSVCNSFFLSYLRALRIKVGNAHTEIHSRNLECAAGSGARLFKYKGNILSLTESVGNARTLLCLKVERKVDKTAYLLCGEVKKL